MCFFFIFRMATRDFLHTDYDLGSDCISDMVENLVLPRTPIGQAYYSRQLYLHVFGVVLHRADGTQRKEDVHLYT